MLKIGQKAPPFELLDQDEKKHQLKNYQGQWRLIYFYPKDDTTGCTMEACTIADIYKDFKRQGVQVFGVSKDTPKSHKKFAEKYSLPFILLSDPAMAVIDGYEASVEKNMFGKKVRGTKRISYIVNPEGKVAKVYEKVDPEKHALEILIDIKNLKKAAKKAIK
jgi:peroxiredoxin Q/BCP